MLNPDYKDILSCLKEEKVEFLIVGAYALAAHGFPRATGDIDIWVRNSRDNAERIMRALRKFGAPTSDLSESDFVSPDMAVQIGVEPCRIDLLTRISGLEFEAAWANRSSIVIDDIDLFILSRQDLLTNKLSAGRDKDLGDIAWLKRNLQGDNEKTAS